jgi:putative oxidoreductase
MFDGSVNAFGTLYLDQAGFAPLGLVLAWLIKLSHAFSAVALIIKRYVKIACVITIFIFVMGIIMVHGSEGWFVVGGGRNGVEYNVLLISVLLYLIAIERRGWFQ